MSTHRSLSALIQGGHLKPEIIPPEQKPGVWLKAVRANLGLRDGADPSDPMLTLSTREPTFFAKRTALEFKGDPDVIVVDGLPILDLPEPALEPALAPAPASVIVAEGAPLGLAPSEPAPAVEPAEETAPKKGKRG